jgi:hypothetical protein
MKTLSQHMTGSMADTYLEYVERNLPEGVSMKVLLNFHDFFCIFLLVRTPPSESEILPSEKDIFPPHEEYLFTRTHPFHLPLTTFPL